MQTVSRHHSFHPFSGRTRARRSPSHTPTTATHPPEQKPTIRHGEHTIDRPVHRNEVQRVRWVPHEGGGARYPRRGHDKNEHGPFRLGWTRVTSSSVVGGHPRGAVISQLPMAILDERCGGRPPAPSHIGATVPPKVASTVGMVSSVPTTRPARFDDRAANHHGETTTVVTAAFLKIHEKPMDECGAGGPSTMALGRPPCPVGPQYVLRTDGRLAAPPYPSRSPLNTKVGLMMQSKGAKDPNLRRAAGPARSTTTTPPRRA